MNYKTIISVDGMDVETLQDILPEKKDLKILFIGKVPAKQSVEVGHYFQGKQGTMFWNKLKKFGVLKVKPNTYDDENLLENDFGITDIVKIPRDFGNEPTDEEYRAGLKRISETILHFKPKIVVFVYKRVLDKILEFHFDLTSKSVYGFNPNLENLFNSKVFVFPMPGTPCDAKSADIYMNELKELI